MKYEVYLPGYGTMISTESVRCVDDTETIESMAKSGHKFKVDGKVIAKSNVHQAVADSLGISVSEVRKQIKEQQAWGTECNEAAHERQQAELRRREEGMSSTDSGMTIATVAEPTLTKVDDSKTKRRVTKIRCIELDTVYKNMTKAGRSLGIDPAYISDAVRLNKEVKGYHFERVEG